MGMSPNPAALQWAIARCGKTVESLKGRWPKIEQWLDGSREPTLRQLEVFARYVHVGLDLLFREDVPRLDLQIADYRTVGAPSSEPSPELYDTVTQMQFRQDWLRDYFKSLECDEIPFVGSFDSSTRGDVPGAAEAIRAYFDIGDTWAFAERDVASALKALRDKIEAKRVSVVINGVVGDNTSRPLSVDEFRGFVLADRMAPLIFVNGGDAKSAQIFTLVHELAHLAFAWTGVVQPGEGRAYDREEERLCDAIAAEVLVPCEVFLGVWRGGSDVFEAIERARKRFKVSFIVCARKALELGLVSEGEFAAAMARHDARAAAAPSASGSGGNYYLTKAYRVGHVFGEAVFAATLARRITYREAFRLTGLNAKTFDEYFKGYAA